jgi:hypothetical protein
MSSNDGTGRDWRDLAEQAAKETDPEKMVKLIQELCSAIDHQARPQQEKPIRRKTDISVDD